MVIAVYLPSCLSPLSSGNLAKIWQSVSAHAERGAKLDGNYGLVFFLGCHPNKNTVRLFESEKGNGALHRHPRSLFGCAVVNSHFTPPPPQHFPLQTNTFASPVLLPLARFKIITKLRSVQWERSLYVKDFKDFNLIFVPIPVSHSQLHHYTLL